MSNRTAERVNAVRKAWEREQFLVSSGEGTRDWTPEQQHSILDIGIALDDEGKPFEGQHMKSVGTFPEYAGDPDNIQFLTRQEHFEAHEGNWQNQTNWYYDPITKKKHLFGNDLIPCKVIPLSNPVRPIIIRQITSEEEINSKEELSDLQTPERTTEKNLPKTKKSILKETSAQDDTAKKQVNNIATSPKAKRTIREKFGNIVLKTYKFCEKHPFLAEAAKNIFLDAVHAIQTYRSGTKTNEPTITVKKKNKSTHSNKDHSVPNDNMKNDHNMSPSDESVLSSEEANSPDKRDYPDERSSPREHDVSGYERQQNGKTVHVKPYKRGRKKMNK